MNNTKKILLSLSLALFGFAAYLQITNQSLNDFLSNVGSNYSQSTSIDREIIVDNTETNKPNSLNLYNSNRTSQYANQFEEGINLIDQGEIKKAIDIFNTLAEIETEKEDAYIALGVSYGLINDHNKALSYHEEAINLNPNNIFALTGIGNEYLLLKKYSKAILYYKRAKNLNDSIPEIYLGLSVTYHMLGEKDLAVENGKIYLELKPDSIHKDDIEKIIQLDK